MDLGYYTMENNFITSNVLGKKERLQFAMDADEIATILFYNDRKASMEILAVAEAWYKSCDEDYLANLCRLLRIDEGSTAEQAHIEYERAVRKVNHTTLTLNKVASAMKWGKGHTPARRIPRHYH